MSSSSSRPWVFTGYSRRLSGGTDVGVALASHDVPDGQPEPGGSFDCLIDCDTIPVVDYESTVKDLEGIRTVAYSWLVNGETTLPQALQVDIEDLVTRMTVMLSLDSLDSVAGNITCINTQYKKLQGKVMQHSEPRDCGAAHG